MSKSIPKPGKTFEEELSAPTKARSAQGAVERWFRQRPDALEFVDAWLAKRAQGSTDWSMADVVARLKRTHGATFKREGLSRYLQRHRSQQLEAASYEANTQ